MANLGYQSDPRATQSLWLAVEGTVEEGRGWLREGQLAQMSWIWLSGKLREASAEGYLAAV